MRIGVELQDRDVRTALNRTIRAGHDMSPAMLAVSEYLKDVAIDSFDRQAAPDGTLWAPLKESTQRQRRRQGFGEAGPILQRRGDLIRSLVSDHGADFAQAGTNLVYATVQHFGAKKGEFGGYRRVNRSTFQPIPWGDIPARPFLGLPPDGPTHIGELVLDWVTRPWL